MIDTTFPLVVGRYARPDAYLLPCGGAPILGSEAARAAHFALDLSAMSCVSSHPNASYVGDLPWHVGRRGSASLPQHHKRARPKIGEFAFV
jgi:hypothetical protein